MIQSFADSETERIFNQQRSTKLPHQIQGRALVKLILLNSAECESDLRFPPSNHFEHLKGNLKEYCSIRINDQWRIQFVFKNNNAYEVEIIDYH